MSTAEELDAAVAGFRDAGNVLKELAEQSIALQSALEALQDARGSLHDIAGTLDDAVRDFSAVTGGLNRFTEHAGRAADALRGADPDVIRREIVQGVEATERLRSRVDEIAGDLKGRIELGDAQNLAEIGALRHVTDTLTNRLDAAAGRLIERIEQSHTQTAAAIDAQATVIQDAINRVDVMARERLTRLEKVAVGVLLVIIANAGLQIALHFL
jgi:uncharacterized phage infection (PIP) family protein YhgE